MRIRVGVDTEVVGRRVHRDARRDRGPGPERDVSEEQCPHGDVVVSFEVDPHLPGGKDREVVDPDILAEAYPSRAVEPSVTTDTGRSADRRETDVDDLRLAQETRAGFHPRHSSGRGAPRQHS